MLMSARAARLPRSGSSRGAPGFHKLLTAVDLYAPNGLQFAGQLLSPGASFDVAALPRPAVLLENAGSIRTAAVRSRYSFSNLWVLWRFDFEACVWVEAARATSTDNSWTVHFAPIAHRLLNPYPAAGAEERAAAPIAERIATVIRVELDQLSREVRCYVLANLDRYIAQQIVAASADLTVRPIGGGEGTKVFPRIGAHSERESGILIPRKHA